MEGVTIVDLIRRNAGRTMSMHVKPFSKKNPDAYLGADELDWPAIMTASRDGGRRRVVHHRVRARRRSAARIAEGELRQLQEAEKLTITVALDRRFCDSLAPPGHNYGFGTIAGTGLKEDAKRWTVE